MSDEYDLVANDVLLPEQFYDGRREFTAERRLLLAILEDALRTVLARRVASTGRDHTHYRLKLIEQAQEWIASRGVRVMSFDWVCQELDIEPEGLRINIARAQEQGETVSRKRFATSEICGRRVAMDQTYRPKKWQRQGFNNGHGRIVVNGR